MIGDDAGLDPATLEQPEEPQPYVEDYLNVNPGVVRHTEAICVDLRRVPPGLELVVLVGGLEESLQLAVTPCRRPDSSGLGGLGWSERGVRRCAAGRLAGSCRILRPLAQSRA